MPEMIRFSMKSAPRFGANFSPVGVCEPRSEKFFTVCAYGAAGPKLTAIECWGSSAQG
jgi:hypothetical protein